ncbi:MAG: peptide ABC transporter substrate-binding protein [Burkholderiaceae bacterium]|nr:peptide ABC transporter substrate-binding protein [Burkholderiaceae bacterium]
MSDHESFLQDALARVRRGNLSRRGFVGAVTALGLPAPMALQLLTQAGLAQAQPNFAYKPTRRGGGGTLKILSWQGPTLLNGHFSNGSKDQLATRLFYEPLATWDRDGSLYPVLAAEIPSLANGGVAKDGLSVTWKLKRGVSWHDGEPFTADDVVFSWELLRNPESAAFTVGTFAPIKEARKIDSHTVQLRFEKPTPAWYDAFVGDPVLPKKHFAAYMGAKSREAPANLKPVGTGPYRLLDFKPGDWVRAEANAAYHMPNRPHFDAIEIKGGGDSVSAARAVLQTGEYDLAWLIQVEDEVLQRLEKGGQGRVEAAPGGDVEYLMLNQSNPWVEVEGERSHVSTQHPLFRDTAVATAIAHLMDRESIQRFIYGRGGVATTNFLNNPPQYQSSRKGEAFDVARANALLDAAGWLRGAGGIRAKGGQPLKLLFQTSTNASRQKVQTIFKQAAAQCGIEVELKATSATVFFSGDAANPDTNARFQADLQMYTITRGGPDPGRFMELFCSWLVANKANKYLGRNVTRWRNDEYDKTFRAAETELDPVKRAALLIRLNDLVCSAHVVVPIVARPKLTAMVSKLQAPISGWTVESGRIFDWHKTG